MTFGESQVIKGGEPRALSDPSDRLDPPAESYIKSGRGRGGHCLVHKEDDQNALLDPICTQPTIKSLSLPKRRHSMADDFEVKSQAFQSWFHYRHCNISPKINLADLRFRNAGRGVCMLFSHLILLASNMHHSFSRHASSL